MKKFQCNIVHQKFSMSHNVLMELLSRGSKVTINETKNGYKPNKIHQIKSIRRTKKLGPTINEHKNEKHALKIETWVLYGTDLSFRWWDVERRQTRRDFDKRVRLTGF